MDPDGVWRAPEEWPEDFPPIPGWRRNPDGGWLPPLSAAPVDTRWSRQDVPLTETPAAETEARESRRAAADKRAMLTVTGIVFALALLVAGAMFLITLAGADLDEEPSPPTGQLIFAGETDSSLASRRREVASEQPSIARVELVELEGYGRRPEVVPFVEASWKPIDVGCLSISEQVLVARSLDEVVFIDQIDCVLDSGRWIDRAHGTTLDRVLDAEVVLFVPAEIAHASGGWKWTDETRAAFASDLAHPATLQVVADGFGHNPRSQDPSAWKPAARSQWCAYAVDWIAVKTRWSLAVTVQERAALEVMLGTCGEQGSAGADPATIVLDEIDSPVISLTS